MSNLVDPTVLVEYRPPGTCPRNIRVTGEQLHGHACVIGSGCTTDEALVDAGHVYTFTYGWAVVAHPTCLEDES